MSKIYSLLILLTFTLAFTSCGKDEDEGGSQQEAVNSFDNNEVNHATENAYLVFSSVLQYDIETMADVLKYRDRVSLYFTNGTIALNDDDNITFSTDTKQVAHHHIRDINDGTVQSTIEDVAFGIGDFVLSPSTYAVINGNVVEEFQKDGVGYGELNGFYLTLTDKDTASLKVSDFSIDYDNMVGTITCTYEITPGIDGAVQGSFTGSFKVLLR